MNKLYLRRKGKYTTFQIINKRKMDGKRHTKFSDVIRIEESGILFERGILRWP
jgi:hypothetical protein